MENEEEIVKWTEVRDTLRTDIDYAIAAWNFIEEIDINDLKVIQTGMVPKLQAAMCDCLEIICNTLQKLNDLQDD